MATFAVYIPIGPSQLELARADDLLDSIEAYEPSTGLVILADHGATARNFARLRSRHQQIAIETIRPCCQDHRGTWLGAGCVSNLMVLDFIASAGEYDFVVKLDLDALVIAPFANTISHALACSPKWGIVGTLGTSANRATRTYKFDAQSEYLLRQAIAVSDRLSHGSHDIDNRELVMWNLFTARQIEDFRDVCRELAPVFQKGYNGAHCQGGAYAISRSFVREMKSRGFLNSPLRWLYLPIVEDRMMGAYCAAVDLVLGDFSAPGEPFGVQAGGLPHSPQELVDMGYSIIHSLKGNNGQSESEIRAWYKARRARVCATQRVQERQTDEVQS